VGNQTAGFYAFDIETGERRWRTPVGGPVNSSAAGAGGVVCFGCDDGQVYGLGAASGRELWTVKTGGPVISSPCIDGGAVFIGSDDGSVYCLR
jgi:outer membrane protein assembly factor BamB